MPNAGTGDAEGDCSVWSFTLLPTESNEAPWVSGAAAPQPGALAPDLVATHVRGLVSLIPGPRGGLRGHAGGGAEGGSGDGANDHDGSGGGAGGGYVAGGGRDEELEELIGWDATTEDFGHEHGLPAYVPRGGFEGLWLVGDGSRWYDPMPGPHHAWLRELAPLDPLRLLENPCRVGPPPYGPLCLEHLHLQGLDLSSGELRTIAELLPGLQVLMLSTCYVPPAELPLLCGAERLHTLVLRMRDLDLCLQPHTAQEALQELCLRSPALEDLQLRPSFEDVVDEYLELDHEAHARWEDCGRAQVQEAVWRLTEAVKLQTDGRKLGPGDGGCGGQGQAAAEGRSRRLRPHVRVELLRPVAWWETDWKEVEYRGHE
ncbi:hypothetical protein CHLRE_02g118125v5 [Chlamydomonas reinhardtii]|uniref:Uncharacterized protein n=1 Tax=Chlamydomonas reinhardtii TaxID=3055 RepID=A0A2K3E3H2_CHLRE|nr:uncharacterized protein CHLRE_02g118125v5 [Chlamydomonas reinhardtii]PNW87329.1 hypothetical protein CHLRE_02g118125v5 [Chlamydomonas reinhardtii]